MKKLLILMMLMVAMLLLFAVPMFAVEMPEIVALGIVDSERAAARGDIWSGVVDFKSIATGEPIIMLFKINGNDIGEIASGTQDAMYEALACLGSHEISSQIIHKKTRGDRALWVHGKASPTVG